MIDLYCDLLYGYLTIIIYKQYNDEKSTTVIVFIIFLIDILFCIVMKVINRDATHYTRQAHRAVTVLDFSLPREAATNIAVWRLIARPPPPPQ